MWVRRTGIAAIVAVLVVLVGSASPAGAVSWKKPVDPYPDLPSAQFKTWVQTSSGPAVVGGYQPGSAGWAEEQAAAKSYLASKGYPAPASASVAKVNAVKTEALIFDSAGKGKAATVTTLPKTLTAPSSLVRGNAATGAFMAGWAITDGVLAMYTANTGTNPLQGVCHDPPWVQGVVGALYMFSAPDCSLPVTNPDDGAVEGWMVEGAGVKARFTRYCQGGDCDKNPKAVWGYGLRGTSTPDTMLSGRGVDGRWWDVGGLGRYESFAPPSNIAQFPSPGYQVCTQISQNCAKGQGVVLTPKKTSATPERRLRCQIQWPDGSWSASDAVAYKERDGVPIKGLNDGCASAWTRRPASVPAGSRPKSIKLDSTDDTGKTTPIQEQVVPELTPEEQAADADKTGKGLVLWKGTESCLTWAADCAGWWEATSKGAATDTDYRCTFGAVAVALAQCYVYEKTFEAQTDDPTITDPATGEKVKWSSTSDNSTDPSTGPSPADECWDEWSSAPNPVEWVFHPVQCALVWAFAPRQAVLDQQWEVARGKWDQTMPAKIGGVVSSAFVVDSVGGCQGPHIFMPFSSFGGQWGWVDVDWYPLNACEAPAAQVAWWSRLISSAVLVYLVGLGIVRRASATVNAPGLG